MKTLNGQPIAEEILADITKRVAKLPVAPRLVVIQVGKNPTSNAYIKRKKIVAAQVGIELKIKQFEENITTKKLRREIAVIAKHQRTTGIIIQLPLPKKVQTQYILDAVPLSKDVDGLSSKNMGKLATRRNAIIPPASAGIVRLLDHYDIAIKGKHIVMIGSGRLIGRPTGLLFLNKGATVTFADENTSNIQSITKMADIIIAGTGKPNLIDNNWVNDGVIIIDAGSTMIKGKSMGNINKELIKEKTLTISPVPGGVGPLTVAMLLLNVANASE